MSSVLAAIVGVGLGFALFSGYKILFPRVNVDIANGRLHDKNKIDALPSGVLPIDACKRMESSFHLLTTQDKSALSPSITYHWNRLSCSKLLTEVKSTDEPPEKASFVPSNIASAFSSFIAPAASSISELKNSLMTKNFELLDPEEETDTSGLTSSTDVVNSIGSNQDKDSSSSASIASPSLKKPVHISPPVNPVKQDCIKWMATYKVLPGSSWGELPEDLQKTWSRNGCDVHVADADASTGTTTGVIAEVASEADISKLTAKKPPINRKDTSKPAAETAALPHVASQSAEWCMQARTKYDVVPLKTWGRLPLNMVDVWKEKRCDLIFTAARMGKRPLSSCPLPSTNATTGGQAGGLGSQLKTKLFNFASTSSSSSASSSSSLSTTDAKSKAAQLAPYFASLPLISVLAATTTRKVVNPSPDNMALFTFMLPSMVRSLDCGFRYEYVLGYDVGDPFYDTEEGMSKTKRWFRDNVELPMLANHIQVTLRPVKVNNSVKKPGPVFIAMARAAYEGGASYFYRINDDTELTANWAATFVEALHSLSPPYGVVGPKCTQGNQKILTHDFVARVHMEIFEMNYYPPELTDWWMDDWISWVYGRSRTFKATNVPVIHHTGAHGQRYQVDHSHEALLEELVKSGRQKIRQWMLQHGVSEQILVEFDKDVYRIGFKHKDVPSMPEIETGNANMETETQNKVKQEENNENSHPMIGADREFPALRGFQKNNNMKGMKKKRVKREKGSFNMNLE